MLSKLSSLVLLIVFVGCADEEKTVKEPVTPEKKEVAKKEKTEKTIPVVKTAESEESLPVELMNAPGAEKTAPMTKAIPTETLIETDDKQSLENPVSKPQVFIVRDGEILEENEANEKASVEQDKETEVSADTKTPVKAENDQIKDFIVTASHLNVRGGPSMQYPVVRVVKRGVKFRSLSIEGIWVQMARDEYVSKHYLQLDVEEYAENEKVK